jgi:hypothetical protein
MKNSQKANSELYIGTHQADHFPSQEQIDALARRLMPEIKRFFSDEQIQQDFAKWKDAQNAAE